MTKRFLGTWPLGILAAAALASALAATAPAGANLSGDVRRTPVVQAVERAAPSVVNITTDAFTRRGIGRGSGSGVIVHPAGYVVTNSHVVRGAARIYVSLCKKAACGPASGPFEARLLEDDPSHDLALLRISRPTPFPYVRLCPTNEVMVGETAIAIGNPYGLGDTVTVGIVSATGRRAAMPGGQTLKNLLQTDASINLGNSGGALLNLEGALIGVNCSIHPTARGISFTVPSDDVRAMLQRNLVAPAPAVAGGSPSPSSSSVRAPAPAPHGPALPPPSRAPALASRIGLSLQSSGGAVRVVSVDPDSAADIAAIKAGDLILDVDDEDVETVAQVERALASGTPGRTYFVGIQRGEERKRAILVLPGR
jgi:serine protease Do